MIKIAGYEIREVLKKHGRGLTVTNIALTPDGRMLPQITVVRVQGTAGENEQ